MRIYGRSFIKKVAIRLYGPLRPIADAVGFNAKHAYEWAYWKSQQLEHGELENDWYEWLFTTQFGLSREFYRGKRILDVGCGPAGSLEWADVALERVGLDPLVRQYRSLGIDRHVMRYVEAGAEAMPFDDGHFDVVSLINSLDHVDDVKAAIAEIVRVVRPNGVILLIVEIHSTPTIAEPQTLSWEIAHQFPGTSVVSEWHHRWRPNWLTAILQVAG
jgi:SAM-dependent methyltransferase